MSEEIELKHCPFCGAKVDFYEGDMDNFDYILCTECGFCMTSENLDSVDELINDWNRRPSPWIPAEKWQPQKGEPVYISIKCDGSSKTTFDVAVFSDWGWIAKNHPFLLDEYVKYVMPIPELPEE